ncbi:Protein of unknown function DUF2611 [Phaffia rhodozyma]|uniref:Uncharacterized protein n=1 Tax=Phaffia rhodozyma TaxID=264483 RepID=A0A0F7SNV9_PHARH|nr:Protein of unknown function DUF2611 [Phaffia rhodozyma]
MAGGGGPGGYTILGKFIKNEYIALATYFTIGAGTYLATNKPAVPKPTVLETVKNIAGSSEEEDLANSIRKFIADAEKADIKIPH